MRQRKPASYLAAQIDRTKILRTVKGLRRTAIVRRVVLPVVLPLVGMLSLAFTSAASAQTPFQANVTFTSTLPSPACSNGATFCGTATIAGYGPASWNFYALGFTPVDTACGSTYQARTDFTLANDPGSTLVLDEEGNLCGLGDEGAGYRGYFAQGPQAAGHPYAIIGNWTVDPTSTGQFSGLNGSGTDLVYVSGAHVAGSYRETVG